jgi:hypothetical protein
LFKSIEVSWALASIGEKAIAAVVKSAAKVPIVRAKLNADFIVSSSQKYGVSAAWIGSTPTLANCWSGNGNKFGRQT